MAMPGQPLRLVLYTKPARAKRGPVPQWQRHMEAIAQLPKARQRFVTEMLQTVLAQAASR